MSRVIVKADEPLEERLQRSYDLVCGIADAFQLVQGVDRCFKWLHLRDFVFSLKATGASQ